MGRHFWGSRKQKRFLRRWKKVYNSYQIAKKTRLFWALFFPKWFRNFPLEDDQRKPKEKQVKTWFSNHTGNRDDGDDSSDDDMPEPNNGTGNDDGNDSGDDDDDDNHPSEAPATEPKRHRRTRKEIIDSTILSLHRGHRKRYTMPRHQAYSKLYYKKKLKSIIEDAWKAEVLRLKRKDKIIRKLKGKVLSKEIANRELTFRNKELKKFLSEETDEVKAEVEAFRLNAAAEENEVTRTTIIQNLEPLFSNLLSNIYNETGMFVTVIATGNSSEQANDVAKFRSYHVGKDKLGSNFGEWHPMWEKSVKNKFLQFYKESTEQGNAAEQAWPNIIGDVPGPTSSTVNPRTTGKKNISSSKANNLSAENVGNSDDSDDEYGEFEGMANSESDSDTSDPEHGHVRPQQPFTNKVHYDRIQQNQKQQQRNEEYIEPSESSDADSDGDLSESEDKVLSTQAVSKHLTTLRSKAVKRTVTVINWDALKHAEQTMQQSKLGQSTKHSNKGDIERHQDADDDLRSSSPLSSAPSEAAISRRVQPANGGSGTSRTASSSSAKKRKRCERDYLVEMKAAIDKALDGENLGILQSWEAFERSKGYPDEVTEGVIGEDHLMPIELKEFMKHYDLSKLIIPDESTDYGRRWIAWWRALQPTWRLPTDPSKPFKTEKDMPKKPVWTKLSVAGQNGIVLAIVGLVIWQISVKKSRRNRTEGKDLKKFFVDVDLVLQMMAVNWSDKSQGGKKARSH